MIRDKHLSSEEIAMCADAVNNNAFENIPINIQKHIDNCHACANEVILVSEIQTEIEKDNIIIKSPKTNSKFIFSNKQIFISVSLAASLIFGIFFITHKLKNDKSIEFVKSENKIIREHLTEKEVEKIIEEDPILISENIKNNLDVSSKEFLANENLELLIEKNKGTYRGSSVSILNNRDINLKKSNKIIVDNPKNEIIYIEILDNNENQISESVISNNQYLISTLERGLYYYKIFNIDFDLIFVGRIKAE